MGAAVDGDGDEGSSASPGSGAGPTGAVQAGWHGAGVCAIVALVVFRLECLSRVGGSIPVAQWR